MASDELSIGDLADAAGLSRRAVRFYVQQGLIPAPTGRGRGSHYDASHLTAIRKVTELQSAGHSLDAIRRIMRGESIPAPTTHANGQAPKPKSVLSAELWTRLRLAEGLELHFDATKFNPDVQDLIALKETIREMFLSE